MRVLITGAGGQLGKTIQNIIPQISKNTYVFARHQDLDITDYQRLEDFIFNENIDIIVNCAAYTDVDQAESDILAAELLNTTAPSFLAKIAYKKNAKLIHISTDYVFSGETSNPYRTTDKVSPKTVYGKTKAEGEKAIIQSKCNYLIIRTAWLYSTYGKNFVHTISSLISKHPEINVVSDQFGSPTNAMDLARFIIDIIEDDKFHKGIYHYTNEGICSWYDFAKEIATLTGNKTCNVNPCNSKDYPRIAPRPSWSVLDKSTTKETFSTEIRNWKEALKDFIIKR